MFENKKKFTALFSIIAMLVSSISAVPLKASAEEAVPEVVFELDFENFDNSTSSASGFSKELGSTHYAANLDPEHGTSYGVTTNTSVEMYQFLNTPIETMARLSFDFRTDTNNKNFSCLRLLNENNSFFNSFVAHANGKMGFYTGTGDQWSMDSQNVSYEVDKWYRVNIWLDLEASVVYYYVDNSFVGSTTINSGLKKLGGFMFSVKNTTYIDNLVLEKVNISAAKAMVKEGIGVPEEYLKPVNVTMETDKIGGIFSDFNDVSIDVALENRLEEAGEYEVNYQIVNSRGREIYNKTEKISFNPNEIKQFTMKPEISEYELYYLYLTVNDAVEDKQYTSELRFSVGNFPESGIKNETYGLCTHTSFTNRTKPELGFPLVDQLGVGFIREDVAGWGHMEKEKGVYNFENKVIDDIIEYASKYNYKVIALVGGNNGLYPSETSVPTTEEGLKALENFYAAYAEHYKGQIDYFEYTNEKDISRQETISCEQYAKALEYFYRGIKRGNPDALVLGCCTSRPNTEWIEGVIKAGNGKKLMDVATIHPYHGAISPESSKWAEYVMETREMLDRNGCEDVQLWSTENGSNSALSYPGQIGQACHNVRLFAINDAYKPLDKMTIYQLQTLEIDEGNEEHCFGIVNGYSVENAYAAKPAYLAMANFFAMTENAVQTKFEEKDKVYTYLYERADGKKVLMMYADTCVRSATVDIGVDSVKCYDIYGNAADLTGINGKYTLVLNDEPIYLMGDFNDYALTEDVFKISDSILEMPVGDKNSVVIESADGLDFDVELETKNSLNVTASKAASGKAVIDIEVLDVPEVTDFSFRLHSDGSEENRDYVWVTLKRNGNVYARLPIGVSYKDKTKMTFKVYPYSDESTERWVGEVTVTNRQKSKAFNGKLTITSPELLKEVLSPFQIDNLAPGESKIIKFNIPVSVMENYVFMVANLEDDTGYTQKVELGTHSDTFYYKKAGSVKIMPLNKADSKPVIDGKITGEEWDKGLITVFDKSDVSYGASDLNIFAVVKDVTFGEDADYGGKEDFSGAIYALWDEEGLYVAAIVFDDVHYQKECPVRAYFDDNFNVNIVGSTTQRHDTRIDLISTEFNGNDPIMFSNWRTLNDVRFSAIETEGELEIIRKDNVTYYEAMIPWDLLADYDVKKHTNFSLSFAIRDYDGDRDKTFSYGGWFCTVE